LGLKRDRVTGELRKLHCEELYDLHFTPNIIRAMKSRRMRWVGHVAGVGESRSAYWVLVGKPEGKRPPGRHWCNVNIILKWIIKRWDGGRMDWIDLAQVRER
jgi:hypothetical protein